MQFFVYILESDRGRHYIGYTSNLQERFIKHNAKHKGFTGTTETWKIIASAETATKIDAMQLERKLNTIHDSLNLARQIVKQ